MKKAFTLIEVMFALAIFAIGMIAIASIFTTAILLQEKTIEDVAFQQISSNAQSMIKAIKLTESDLLAAGAVADGKIYPINILSEEDRTYGIDNRKYEWYTFARKDLIENWWLINIMIAKRNDPENIIVTTNPGGSVFNATSTDMLKGDYFMDCNGAIYVVKHINYITGEISVDGIIYGSPTSIWQAKEDECKKIVIIII